jgi:hypothetical protein
MIICKMTCVIQGMLLSHYLCGVNLSNYRFSHVPKSVTPYCIFTHMQMLVLHMDRPLHLIHLLAFIFSKIESFIFLGALNLSM